MKGHTIPPHAAAYSFGRYAISDTNSGDHFAPRAAGQTPLMFINVVAQPYCHQRAVMGWSADADMTQSTTAPAYAQRHWLDNAARGLRQKQTNAGSLQDFSYLMPRWWNSATAAGSSASIWLLAILGRPDEATANGLGPPRAGTASHVESLPSRPVHPVGPNHCRLQRGPGCMRLASIRGSAYGSPLIRCQANLHRISR